MDPHVAILLSTCDAYSHIARLTCNLIHQYWSEHPEIYVCGCTHFTDEKMISFTCDPKDWIGITYEAVSELEKIGYEYCYLILEDHIPFGECNSNYLNRELPKLACELRAVHVSLVGWDQFQPFNGQIMGSKFHKWMNNSNDFRWKFDLHPGLWEIKSFKEILGNFVSENSHIFSAREFEGLAGAPDVNIPLALKQSTYKICGDERAEGSKWFQKKWKRNLVRQVIHCFRLLRRLMTGSGGLARLDSGLQAYTNYFNGPYPMYWSGIMTKGQINDNAIRFLHLVRRNEMADTIETIIAEQIYRENSSPIMDKFKLPTKLINSCPNCNSYNIIFFHNYTHHNLKLQYDICNYCGLIFQNPTYSDEKWKNFYHFHYREIYNKSNVPTMSTLREEEDRAEYYVHLILKKTNNISSHLDIGCSAGVLIKKLGKALALDRQCGIELGDEYRQFCNKSGLDVYISVDELLSQNQGKFDLITMCHVLEHIPNPISYLKHIVDNLLNEGGFMFIEVPNVRGGRPFEIAHPICFASKTLEEVLVAAGLEVLYCKQHGKPKTINPRSKIYLSSITRKSGCKLENVFRRVSPQYLRSSRVFVSKHCITKDGWFLSIIRMFCSLVKHLSLS